MAQNMLTHTGYVAPRRSVRRLTQEEVEKETEIAKRINFDNIIRGKLGDSMTLPPNETKPSVIDSSDFTYDTREDDEDEPLGWIDGDPIDANGVPVFETPSVTPLLMLRFSFPMGSN